MKEIEIRSLLGVEVSFRNLEISEFIYSGRCDSWSRVEHCGLSAARAILCIKINNSIKKIAAEMKLCVAQVCDPEITSNQNVGWRVTGAPRWQPQSFAALFHQRFSFHKPLCQ
jgi:hypothetical protein